MNLDLQPPFNGPNKQCYLTLWRNYMVFNNNLKIHRGVGAPKFASNASYNALLQSQQYKSIKIGALQMLEIMGIGFPPYGKGWICLRSAA